MRSLPSSALLTTFLALFVAAALAPISASATEDPSADLQGRIEQINVQITSEAELLEQIQRKIADVDGQLRVLKAESDKLRAEDRALSKKLTAVTAERHRLEEELQELDTERERVANLSIKRVRATYTNPPGQALSDLFRQAASPSVSHFGLYLAAVRSFDRRTLDSLAELKRSREEKKAELAGTTTKQERVVQEIKAKRADLAQQMAAQEPLAKELKSQLEDREEVVTQLKAQLLRFETVLTGLTGGAEEPPSVASRTRAKRGAITAPAPVPFKGPGLATLKGKLRAPVVGRLVVPFGREVTTKTGIAGKSKGVEFASATGAEVAAVAQGKIIFSGRMPVLGSILIVDHGERYYSLYGRLGAARVERGAEVAQGDVLGTAGEPEAEGRNFYFEIRKNGEPVNPQPFFKKM